jgi:hypothetical protein
MKTFNQIFRLSIVWFSVWAILIFYLQPQGIDYISSYILTAIYFLLVLVALTSMFKNEIGNYVENFSPKDLLVMILFSIAVASIYYFLSLVAENNIYWSMRSSLPPMLQLDDKFLVTKAFEIMFQQTFFMICLYHLFSNKLSKHINIILFGLFSMFIHFPILFVSDSMGKIIFAFSFFAGLIFAYFITRSKRGFIYGYMVHFGLYVLLAAIFWFGGAQFLVKLI